jgi:hypothetical protein
MADLADVERMVDDWERDAVAKSQRYQVRDAAAAYQAQDDATADAIKTAGPAGACTWRVKNQFTRVGRRGSTSS